MSDITQLLHNAYGGDEKAREELWAVVYDALRGIALRELQDERSDHTLSATALVNEVYFKLIDLTRITWESRGHFYAVACKAMRQILVDYARSRRALKRAHQKVPLEEAFQMAREHSDILIELHEALELLGKRDPRMAQVVELRYFGGLKAQEAAEAMDVGLRTANRLWSQARAYLLMALRDKTRREDTSVDDDTPV